MCVNARAETCKPSGVGAVKLEFVSLGSRPLPNGRRLWECRVLTLGQAIMFSSLDAAELLIAVLAM